VPFRVARFQETLGRVSEVSCPVVVGRESELALMRGRLRAAAAGRGSLLFVTGEAGVGKSRLSREVAGWAAAAGVPVLGGRAVPEAAGGALRPWTEVVLQSLRARGWPDDPAMAPWRAALQPMLSEAGSGSASLSRSSRSCPVTGEALLRLWRWVGGSGPVVVVLEDLHWADPDSLAVLEYLADNLAGESVLGIGTLRTGPSSGAVELVRRLTQRDAGFQVGLAPLSGDAVAEMVRACAPEAGEEVISRVQSAADGLPLLVEELLATPGRAASVQDAVASRLLQLSASERLVVSAAAVLGRVVDWSMLPEITGLAADDVVGALEKVVSAQLLVRDDDGELRFRHALTREAVLATMIAPRRVGLARTTLAVLDAVRPGHDRADLAVAAGNLDRAGAMHATAGLGALRQGALNTAVVALGQAAEQLRDPAAKTEARIGLVHALAVTGRLDDALSAAAPLLAQQLVGPRVRVELGRAAVEATRWPLAVIHLEAADELLAADRGGADPELLAELRVLQGEVALAADDLSGARRRAQEALEMVGPYGAPDAGCHAWELTGRSHRVHDLDAARAAFLRAYELAERAELPVRRLRALHELGTIAMLDHGGSEQLLAARAVAEELGALSTLAVLDVQLAGAYLQQFDTGAALHHISLARGVTEPLRLGRLHAYTYVFEACVQALLGDRPAVSEATACARRAAPGDVEVDGLITAGGFGMLELLWGDQADALPALDRGLAALHTVEHSPPGPYRGLWPLVVAVADRPDAPEALEQVRRSGVAVNRVNRGYLAYTEAVLGRSAARVEVGDAELAYFPTWQHLGRVLVAEAALRGGWGEPGRWLRQARSCFVGQRLDHLARRCARLLGEPDRSGPVGMTAREAEVLALLAQGLANKEIATRLHVSFRTVEKHVESLLRKAGARSRTHLAAMVRAPT
jgi:DNA-binding CsgD family transcriptional regulator